MGSPGEFYDEDGEQAPLPGSGSAKRRARRGSAEFYDQDEIDAAEASPTPIPEPGNGGQNDDGRPRSLVDIYAILREHQGLAGPSKPRTRRPQHSRDEPDRALKPEPRTSRGTPPEQPAEPDRRAEADRRAEPDRRAAGADRRAGSDRGTEPDGRAEPDRRAKRNRRADADWDQDSGGPTRGGGRLNSGGRAGGRQDSGGRAEPQQDSGGGAGGWPEEYLRRVNGGWRQKAIENGDEGWQEAPPRPPPADRPRRSPESAGPAASGWPNPTSSAAPDAGGRPDERERRWRGARPASRSRIPNQTTTGGDPDPRSAREGPDPGGGAGNRDVTRIAFAPGFLDGLDSPGFGAADAPTRLDMFRWAPVIALPPPAPPGPGQTDSAPLAAGTALAPPGPATAPPGPTHAPPGPARRPAGRSPAPSVSTPAPVTPGSAGQDTRRGQVRPSAPSTTQTPTDVGRNTGIVAAGTFLSRVTGFLRTLTILGVLGSTGLGDAYNLANTVPNIVYELILGGVLSATMIPVFVEQFRRQDRAAAQRSISAVLTAITAVLVGVTLLLYLFAPAVIHFYLLFNHQVTGSAERAVGTSLLRLFAAQVLFLGAIVVTTALLNARHHFAVPAFSPVINNLIMIVAILATKVVATTLNIGPFSHDHSAILVLGLGTTFGYFVQFLIHVPALARAGIRPRVVWDLRDPAVRQISRLSSWLVGVVLANQASLTVVIILAAQVPGSFTVYSAAFMFFQLPYALFAVSLASVLTPDLAERWSAGDRTGFRHRMIAGTRITLAVMIPAGIGYAIVARPVILLAARHGATSLASAHLLASCLALFAIGLPGYSAFLLLLRGLQAMQDAKAMFSVYLLENAISVVLAFALYPSLGVRGLVLAWVMPYTLCSFVAVGQLRRRMGGRFGGYSTMRALVRMSVATGIMAVAVIGVGRLIPADHGDAILVLRLIAQVIVGAVVYVYSARVFGLGELDPVLSVAERLLGRRPPRSRPPDQPRPGGRPPDAPPSTGRGRRQPIGRHVRTG